MIKRLVENREKKRFIKDYGQFAFYHKEEIKALKDELGSIPFIDLTFVFFSDFVKQYESNRFPFSVISSRLDEAFFFGYDLDEYLWIATTKSRHFFTMEQVPAMKRFLILIEGIEKNYTAFMDFEESLKGTGLSMRDYPDALLLLDEIEKAKHEMHSIINPASKQFFDTRIEKEILQDELNQKISNIVCPKPVPIAPKEYQLESLRQLQLVTDDIHVSDSIKKEARETMKLIQETLDKEKEQQAKEQAEMNARAVIQTSKLMHRLPSNINQ
ncbi:hypothetical protein JMA_38410 (plasmid) [Jeotgalibacillus malaysiensis]|uniref:Uncharacterized protein n=1 Tax=Jeotgalibacillus malaysiensis TaxID=1508404 RepID=A0A0B5AYU0_9BACL|nr:hypothetical protein [Jeotgalibacillus malaysiensis]AJD93159.1 hypothetical protein JMA_38410 [Jeotgalibacillus malaysiensis]